MTLKSNKIYFSHFYLSHPMKSWLKQFCTNADIIHPFPVLFRQCVGLAIRKTVAKINTYRKKQRILSVWPPTQSSNDLDVLYKAFEFYLGNSVIPHQTFTYDKHSTDIITRSVTTTGSGLNNAKMPFHKAKQLHFDAEFRVWNTGLLKRRLPFRPRDFVISFDRPLESLGELLRLSLELIDWKEFAATRIFRPPCTIFSSCALVCPGPSSVYFMSEANQFDLWIGANAIVMNQQLCRLIPPFAICFIDPWFFSYENTALKIRNVVIDLIKNNKTRFITVMEFAALIPQLFPRSCWNQIYFLESMGRECYRQQWGPNCSRIQIGRFENVLTDCLIPLASTLAKTVTFYGCDGIPPGINGSFPKAGLFDKFDAEIQETSNSDKESGSEQYHKHMQQCTAYVARQCKKKGTILKLRVKSWNYGLKNVPVVI